MNQLYIKKTPLKLNIKHLYLLVGLLFSSYVLIRAFTVGITYDEAWTFTDFVPMDFISILNYSPPDANNHIINTLLIKLAYIFNDDSLFLARLPNVLSFGLYIFYAYKLTYKFLSKTTGFGCFLLLLFNPFALDFFGLARGYGLALAFQMGALYFTINYFNSNKVKDALIALIVGALAVLSNFSFLNFWITMLIVLILISYHFKEQINLKKFTLYSSLSTLILGLILYEPIRKLKIGGNFYYGGESFYSDTLLSLTKYSMYSPTASSITFIVLNGFIVSFLVILAYSFYKDLRLSPKNIFVLLLLGCILSLVAQNLFFDTLYLIDRTALLFYPLIICTLVFALARLEKTVFSNLIILLFVIAFATNFFSRANFYKTANWYFDAHTQEILRNLNKEGEDKGKVINFDFSWPFQSALSYYLKSEKFPFIKNVKSKQNRKSINKNADYYIYLDHSLEKVGYSSTNQIIHNKVKRIETTYPKEYIIIYSLTNN